MAPGRRHPQLNSGTITCGSRFSYLWKMGAWKGHCPITVRPRAARVTGDERKNGRSSWKRVLQTGEKLAVTIGTETAEGKRQAFRGSPNRHLNGAANFEACPADIDTTAFWEGSPFSINRGRKLHCTRPKNMTAVKSRQKVQRRFLVRCGIISRPLIVDAGLCYAIEASTLQETVSRIELTCGNRTRPGKCLAAPAE